MSAAPSEGQPLCYTPTMEITMKPEPHPRQPPELLALWHRKGNWQKAANDRWQQSREGAKLLSDTGWLRIAYQLGWKPSELYGLYLVHRDNKRIFYSGLTGQIAGGTMLMIDSKVARICRGGKVFIFRREQFKAWIQPAINKTTA